MAATMHSEETQGDAAASRATSGANRLSRRQAIGRMSVVASAGAAAWVAPEILTAKAAGGATLSAPAVTAGASTLGSPPELPASKPGDGSGSPANTLAFTGLNIERDTQVGAALIAGGWALQHWASRASSPVAPPKGPGAPA
jgi:hypothetical protein